MMSSSFRRIVLSLIFLLSASGIGSLQAYSVAVSANVTLTAPTSGTDPLGLAGDTATISTTLESELPQGGSATYANALISVSIPALGLTNAGFTGTLTVSSSGSIVGTNFVDSTGHNSFNPTIVLSGVNFPGTIPSAFGTASLNAASSQATYTVLGVSGSVGLTGSISATGLTVSPQTALNVSYNGGTPPSPVQIAVGSNGGSALAYTVTVAPGTNQSSTSFLQLSSLSGTTPSTLIANFSTSVASGTYTAVIQINTTSDSGSAPVTIPVTYNVTGAGGQSGILASPSFVTFNFDPGSTTPSSQTVQLTSTSSTQLSFTAAASVPWVTVTTSSNLTPATLTIAVDPSTLPTGVSNGTVTITVPGGTVSIPVNVLVGSGTSGQPVQVSPTSLVFQFSAPGSLATSQPLSVTSTGGAEGFTASVASGSFLSLTPASGVTPGTVTVTANNTGLAQGVYSGSIQIAGSGASPVTIPVTILNGQGQSVPVAASPATLTFNYVVGHAVPVAQQISISAAIPLGFSVTSDAAYIQANPKTGTTNASVTVGVNPAGLAIGSYTDHVTVTTNAGSSVVIPVIVNVSPNVSASLSATPLSVAFTYPPTSSSPLSQTVAISGTAAVPFSASTSTPWLTVQPANGTTNGSIVITANPKGLTQGINTGSVSITSPEGINSPLNIPVSFNVTQTPGATLTATPSAVAFAYQAGGSAPPTQTVSFATDPAGAAYTVSAFGASWLQSSVSADGTTATLTVDPTGLNPGVYVGSLKITGAAVTPNPFFVPVTLTVSTGAALGVSPTTLSFNYLPGGDVPAAQTVAITISAPSSFSANGDSPWLIVTPASGSAPGLLTVSIDPTGLAVGTYRGNVSVSGGGAAPAIASVPVILNIGSQTVPLISAVTNGISFANQVGAPGLIVSLWGQGLGPVQATPLQLANPTTISTMSGGTQVFADGIPMPILFASSQQVNAIIPFSVQGQTSTQIQLQYQGITSNAVTLPLQDVAPGLFSADSSGQGGGAILNQDLSVNTAQNPAAAGSVISIYGGGGGATAPAGSDGLIIPVTAPFPAPAATGSVTIGGQPAPTSYYGDAPGLVSGVLQINATVPAGLASGPQAVILTIGSFSSQSNLFVYVK